ncbi:MAG: permease-like cell division protein FtsX [Clostridiales bacterium]|nr:permease-like cell division protein FtsX [Clostridiales bacterium]
MKVSSIGYVCRDGIRNIWRNKMMSVASISTVAISLFLLGFVWLFITNVDHMVTSVESELEINAYIETSYTRDQGAELSEQISRLPGVATTSFVTKEEALIILNGRFGADANLSDTVGVYNPLPDLIKVKATDPDLVPGLAMRLENTAGIEMVRYGKGMVERLLQTADWVRRAGLLGLLGISVAAIFLISTSIRLTVYSRREEITIMRLVGATNWYIRWPFLVEGLFIGVFGSVMACGILYYGYLGLAKYLTENLYFIPLLSDMEILINMGLNILAYGGLLGLIGSFLSVIRYLRV